MEIELLKKHPEYANTIASWLYDEFNENFYEYEFWLNAITCPSAKDGLPITFIALDNKIPIGTVSLWRSDLLSRQDLTPWLAVLFVKEEYRQKHIGTALQKKLTDYSKNLGFDEVYLYTDLVNYYEKTGWIQFDTGIEVDGKEKNIYITRKS